MLTLTSLVDWSEPTEFMALPALLEADGTARDTLILTPEEESEEGLEEGSEEGCEEGSESGRVIDLTG